MLRAKAVQYCTSAVKRYLCTSAQILCSVSVRVPEPRASRTADRRGSARLNGTHGTQGGRMDAKKSKDMRRRLLSEYEALIESINRNRTAAEEIRVENTEDESDLDWISHE